MAIPGFLPILIILSESVGQFVSTVEIPVAGHGRKLNLPIIDYNHSNPFRKTGLL